jgi:hypothetical protein
MLAGPWREMLTGGPQDAAGGATPGSYADETMLVDGER